jgi:two-component system nitrate/nitrite response regulator NarL
VSRAVLANGKSDAASSRSRRQAAPGTSTALAVPAEETTSPQAYRPIEHVTPIRIVVADGHPVVREGLIRVIEEEARLEIVGHAGDGIEAIALVRQLNPDILMLDHTVPQMAGIEVLRELARAGTNTRVIVMAASLRREEVLEVLQLGAYGIVMKNSAMSLIVKSIPTVMAGQYWIGRESISDLITYLRHGTPFSKPVSNPPKPRFGLTRRELQIVSSVVAAYSNKEIAERFTLSEDTVKHHLSNIFDKLGLSNRLELALFAINHRLVESESNVAP